MDGLDLETGAYDAVVDEEDFDVVEEVFVDWAAGFHVVPLGLDAGQFGAWGVF